MLRRAVIAAVICSLLWFVQAPAQQGFIPPGGRIVRPADGECGPFYTNSGNLAGFSMCDATRWAPVPRGAGLWPPSSAGCGAWASLTGGLCRFTRDAPVMPGGAFAAGAAGCAPYTAGMLTVAGGSAVFGSHDHAAGDAGFTGAQPLIGIANIAGAAGGVSPTLTFRFGGTDGNSLAGHTHSGGGRASGGPDYADFIYLDLGSSSLRRLLLYGTWAQAAGGIDHVHGYVQQALRWRTYADGSNRPNLPTWLEVEMPSSRGSFLHGHAGLSLFQERRHWDFGRARTAETVAREFRVYIDVVVVGAIMSGGIDMATFDPATGAHGHTARGAAANPLTETVRIGLDAGADMPMASLVTHQHASSGAGSGERRIDAQAARLNLSRRFHTYALAPETPSSFTQGSTPVPVCR